jgi:hypothetical protein
MYNIGWLFDFEAIGAIKRKSIMTYKKIQDCINEYKISLLEMIPAYYSNTSGKLVEVEPPEDAKDAMIHLMDESLLPQGSKKKNVLVNKRSSKGYDFTEKMKRVLQYIDTFAQENKWERFRFRFFDKKRDEYHEANLISGSVEEDTKAILSSFMAYLRHLRDNGYDECNAYNLVTKKMHSWGKKYLQEYAEAIDRSSVAYVWSINDITVICNGKHIAKLPNLQFKLFERLFKTVGKNVKNKDLEKCWSGAIVTSKNLSTTMSKLNKILVVGLKQSRISVYSRVIEPKNEYKKNVAYKLVTESTTYQ